MSRNFELENVDLHREIGELTAKNTELSRMLRRENEVVERLTAQHEADQRVIEAAKKGIAALKPLLSYDSYETEYDGQTIEICPSCGKQDGKHSDSCEFVLAKAALAEFDKVVKP